MSNAHSLGRFYIVIGAPQAQGAPLIDRAHTMEKEGLFRRGDGILVRAPFTGDRPTRGVVLGWWRAQ